MAQQTAVEWLLYEQFKLNMTKGLTKSQYLARRKANEEQAKAMEKDQIRQAWENGALPDLLKEYKNSRTYYKDLYEKDK